MYYKITLDKEKTAQWLRDNGYFVIKITDNMDRDMKECSVNMCNGFDRQCDFCSCHICLVEGQ